MNQTSWTRRKALRSGAIASGGLLLGVGAVGTAGARQKPGSAFVEIFSNIQKGDTFTIDGDTGLTVELSPSCKDGPPSKTYQVFSVTATFNTALIAVNQERGVEPGPTEYEVVSVKKDCEPAFQDGIKFAYKPA